MRNKIFDVFLFLNELDLLELRLKTLFETVDYFVITEIDETFSGIPKPLIFEKYRSRFMKYNKKIIYNPVTKKELSQLNQSRWVNFVTDFNRELPHKHCGKAPKKLKKSLKREISHRDSAILGFYKIASENDFILLSDLDEIPNPQAIAEVIKKKITTPHYFKMSWYLYWINNKVSKSWFGTVMFRFKSINGNSLDNFRFASSDEKTVPGTIVNNGGWHFSYLGGADAISYKLQSHPFQGYKAQIAIILDKLGIRRIKNTIKNNRDLFFQNRELNIVNIDMTYPKSILKDEKFIDRYSC